MERTERVAGLRHAEALAHELGGPLGTLLLTLSITTIEVASISAVMLHGANPALARDLRCFNECSEWLGGPLTASQRLAILSIIRPGSTRTPPGPTLSRAARHFW